MPVEIISDYLLAEERHLEHSSTAEVLLAESSHRIANNLTLIAGLLHLRGREIARAERPLNAEEVCLVLDEAAGRIETAGRLHRLLAQDGGASSVDLGRYLHEIAQAAVDSMSRVGDMTLQPRIDSDCQIHIRQALPVGVIVGELVTNAVKYAHPARVGGRVEVSCQRRPEGAMLIEVADDGVGLTEGFDPMKGGGLGMRTIRALARQLGARLSFVTEGCGLTVRLLLPPQRPVEVGDETAWA